MNRRAAKEATKTLVFGLLMVSGAVLLTMPAVLLSRAGHPVWGLGSVLVVAPALLWLVVYFSNAILPDEEEG